MKRATIIGMFLASLGAPAFAGGYSTQIVEGPAKGNHDLDCLIIRPWEEEPGAGPYPVIGWANGWGQGEVLGANTTSGYTPGLIEWAKSGPYIVIAARQWSARSPDQVRCLEWLIEQNEVGGDYEGLVDAERIGIAGHSQGGGATLETGDGGRFDLSVRGIVAMNPYGPDWPKLRDLLAPVFLLGGALDTTTPPSSYEEVWLDVLAGDVGGINAIASDGTHNSDAWGVNPDGSTMSTEDAAMVNFVRFQDLTELFWKLVLKGDAAAGASLEAALGMAPWDVEIYETPDFQL